MLGQMRKHLKSKRAQSTLEYAILIAVVVGALIALNLYMRRAVSGKLRESADDVGVQFDREKGEYYQKSELVLKDKKGETTHSMMNVGADNYVDVKDDGVKGRMDWRRKDVTIGQGSEAQWTEESVVRTMKEATTTKDDAYKEAGKLN
jgi:hypothetical protein